MLFKLMFPTVLYALKIRREDRKSPYFLQDRKSPYFLHSPCTALVISLIQRSRKESFKLKHYEAQKKNQKNREEYRKRKKAKQLYAINLFLK